jgi:hypothetical protein
MLNNTMKKNILLFFIALSYNLSAQDTLLFRDSNTQLVIIKEISTDNIKYTRFDFQDGPSYILSKDSINEIRFFSGLKENFSSYKSKSAINPYLKKPTARGESIERIDIDGNRYHYKGETYRYREISEIAFNKCDNKELVQLMNQKTNNQILYGVSFIGIPITVVGVVTCVIGAYDMMWGGSSDFLKAGALITAGGLITLSLNTYSHSRIKYLNKKIVKVYNESF